MGGVPLCVWVFLCVFFLPGGGGGGGRSEQD